MIITVKILLSYEMYVYAFKLQPKHNRLNGIVPEIWSSLWNVVLF